MSPWQVRFPVNTQRNMVQHSPAISVDSVDVFPLKKKKLREFCCIGSTEGNESRYELVTVE
jgi:hypothetical protein